MRIRRWILFSGTGTNAMPWFQAKLSRVNPAEPYECSVSWQPGCLRRYPVPPCGQLPQVLNLGPVDLSAFALSFHLAAFHWVDDEAAALKLGHSPAGPETILSRAI